MFKYFVANNEIYRVTIKREHDDYFHLKEQMLQKNHWTDPVEFGINEKGLTLEKAINEVYAFPNYYDSVKEAKKAKKKVA